MQSTQAPAVMLPRSSPNKISVVVFGVQTVLGYNKSSPPKNVADAISILTHDCMVLRNSELKYSKHPV